MNNQEALYQIQKKTHNNTVWIDVANREEAENSVIHGYRWREVFLRAEPPAPFVVESKSFERGLFILNETLDDCGDSEHGLLLALTEMGVEVEGE